MAKQSVREPALEEADPHSYIAALKHFSARAKNCAERNRMVDKLRKRTDTELAKMGIKRCEIEQLVYKRAQ